MLGARIYCGLYKNNYIFEFALRILVNFSTAFRIFLFSHSHCSFSFFIVLSCSATTALICFNALIRWSRSSLRASCLKYLKRNDINKRIFYVFHVLYNFILHIKSLRTLTLSPFRDERISFRSSPFLSSTNLQNDFQFQTSFVRLSNSRTWKLSQWKLSSQSADFELI